MGADLSVGLNTAQILLAAVPFTADLRSCPHALARKLRRPALCWPVSRFTRRLRC
ncbi:hypothetical protein ACIBO4_14610 [Streptomyces sp. NPDC050149]|uniref:hypothetical protein n=1 Tax=Streptomyces sp. NPDC050149 TaxID=3365603 RepID=UPI00378B7CE1